MRKNTLIKKLQEIKGNPEVMLWNGLVGDFVPVGKIGSETLVKMSKEYWKSAVRNEECIDGSEPSTDESLDNLYECHHNKYEYDPDVSEDEIKSRKFLGKSVVYIDTKLTGKKFLDRLGSIDY